MTDTTSLIDTPLSAGEVAEVAVTNYGEAAFYGAVMVEREACAVKCDEVVSKSRNHLFRSGAAICAGEIRGKITSAAEELEGSWLLQETTRPECVHKPSED